MGFNNWIEVIKDEMKQKQETRMKQKYLFLTDAIAESEKRTNEKIQALYECVEKNRLDIAQELLNVSQFIQVLDNNLKKMQLEMDESETIVHNEIEKIQNCVTENIADMKETISSIIAKLEQVSKDEFERDKQIETSILLKSQVITSEIENVKSLIQLLAVNELIDEIDVEK